MTEPTGAGTEDQTGLVCPECGYDLRGIDSGQCPECGQAIDRAGMSVARIPWSHRESLGAFKAYWRTSLLVIFRPRRLAEEVARPVSFADAQAFRHITVLLAWLPMVLTFIAIVLFNWGDATAGLHVPTARLGWFLEAACFVVGLLALWLALLMITGVGSYFYHPASLPIKQQNRGVALSYYTCAPLAWFWVPGALSAISVAIAGQEWGQRGFGEKVGVVFAFAAMGFLTAIIVLFWLRAGGLMRKVTHCGTGRSLAMTLYLPFAWWVCFAIALLIPAALVYVSLMILSFR
jgi:hypothetical protein